MKVKKGSPVRWGPALSVETAKKKKKKKKFFHAREHGIGCVQPSGPCNDCGGRVDVTGGKLSNGKDALNVGCVKICLLEIFFVMPVDMLSRALSSADDRGSRGPSRTRSVGDLYNS